MRGSSDVARRSDAGTGRFIVFKVELGERNDSLFCMIRKTNPSRSEASALPFRTFAETRVAQGDIGSPGSETNVLKDSTGLGAIVRGERKRREVKGRREQAARKEQAEPVRGKERTSNFLGGGVRSIPKGVRDAPRARRWSKLN